MHKQYCLLWSSLLSLTALVSAPLSAQVCKDDGGPYTSYSPLLLPADAALRGIRLSGQAKVYSNDKARYRMECGSALFTVEEATTIETCRASIRALPGAAVVVDSRSFATRVLNLSDKRRNSVKVIIGKNHVVLNPGEEAGIVEQSAGEAKALAPCTGVRYRRPQLLPVKGGPSVVVAEFSLGDALKQCAIFQQLRESPLPEDQKLLAEIVKTAAAVNTMFAKSREKYTANGAPERRAASVAGTTASRL